MATITVTPIKTFISGETVTPAKLNELSQSTVALTAGSIVDADVSASAAIALSKLATGALPTAITVASANIVDGTITLADLAAAVTNTLVPAGAVMPFAMDSAPSGWLAADGEAVSRTDYAALFSAIGTTHGVGNGSTTFNLPDLRGIFVRGSGSQTVDGTAYSGTFAAKQAQAVNTNGTLVRQSSNHWAQGGGGVGIPMLYAGNNVAAYGTSNSYFGGTETRPANIALLYCIKF